MKKTIITTAMAILMATTPIFAAETLKVPETNYENIRIYSDGSRKTEYLSMQVENQNGKLEKNQSIELKNCAGLLTINGSLALQNDMREVNGTMYIPLRTMAELLHGSVTWNAQDQSVIFRQGSQSLIFVVDSRICMWNGKEIKMAKPMISIDKTTYLPVRALAELTGYEIAYYPKDAPENIWDYPQIALSKYPKGTEKITPQQAANIAEEKWISGLAVLEKYEGKKVSAEYEERFHIDFAQTPIENDRYYLFAGKHKAMNIMVDKYTGAVYRYSGNKTMAFNPEVDGTKAMFFAA